MTHEHDQVDTDAARLELDAAVAQLLQPTVVTLDRVDPLLDPVAAAQRIEDRLTESALQRRLAMHRRSGQPTQASLVSRQLRDHRRRIVARRVRAEVRTAEVPPLLDQLLDAVPGSGGSNGAAGVGVHRAPLALGAAQLLADIERSTRWGLTATGGVDPHPDVREQLRRWASRAEVWATDAPQYLARAASCSTEWCTAIRSLLEPGRRTTITDPCPHCRHTVAYVQDDTGATVRRAALEVDLTHEVGRCWRCLSTWPARFLAQLLDEQRRSDARAQGGLATAAGTGYSRRHLGDVCPEAGG